MPTTSTAPAAPTRVRVSVPAKLNLFLAVGPRRPDGFHELDTVYFAVDLYDHVVATHADSLSVRVTGTVEGVPTDHTNIAWRAAELLAAEAGIAAGVQLDIDKRIPVAGGMAGGSADAAGALLACRELWGTDTPDERLAELAAELGSDVPFALLGGAALGRGRGEQLRPIACPPLHWVVIPAPFGISAGAAYRELDRLRASGTPLPGPTTPPEGGAPVDPPVVPPVDAVVAHLEDLAAQGSDDCVHGSSAATILHNDLEPAALSLRPELADRYETAAHAGALNTIVSGSGPTMISLYPSQADARRAAAHLSTIYPGAVAASGPAEPKVSR